MIRRPWVLAFLLLALAWPVSAQQPLSDLPATITPASSGGGSTISGLTDLRLVAANGTTGVSTPLDAAYDSVYTGALGGGMAHPSIVTNTGINVNLGRTATGNPIVSLASFFNVAPATDLATAIQSTSIKGEVYSLITETHNVGSWEAGDFYLNHRGTGTYSTLIAASGYVKVDGASNSPLGNIIGFLSFPLQTHASAVSALMLGVGVDFSDGNQQTIQGATTDMEAYLATGMSIPSGFTPTNRYVLKVDAYTDIGTVSGNDAVLWLQPNKPSYITGRLELGRTAAAASGTITYVGGTSGSFTAGTNATGTAFILAVNDSAALGSTTRQWSDLFLAEGGVINFDNGDVTITQTGDVLAFAGASTSYNFDAPLVLTGKVSTYNNVATAGIGVVPVRSEAISVSARTTSVAAVTFYVPPATAGRYEVTGILTTTSSTNTGTIGFTLDYVDSQGTVHTADPIPVWAKNTTAPVVAPTIAASQEYHMQPWVFTIDNSATVITLKTVVTGTVSYFASGSIRQVGP